MSFEAGRLSKFLPEWRKITTDPVILSWLKGYTLPFISRPHQSHQFANKLWSKSDCRHITSELARLLAIGAIVECKPCAGQFISRIFLVSKPGGKKRLILNLKNLNKFLQADHFKMEDKNTVLKLLSPNAYMASLDIKDAYFHLSVKKSHRKFLRFQFKNRLYEYTSIPFGLSSAPFIFTKLLKPLLHSLRSQNLLSVAYLDDFLLLANSFEECQYNVRATINLLSELGFIINFDKSCLTPEKRCTFLGFVFDSSNMTVGLPQEKRQHVLKWLDNILHKKVCSIRYFSRFIGKIVSITPVFKYGKLYTKNFERVKYLALKKSRGSYKHFMEIPQFLLADLLWWKSHLLSSVNPIVLSRIFSIEIFSDASKIGWGAYCNEQRANGLWTTVERSFHINKLELLAAYFALKCFARDLSNCDILLHVDNTTAMAYINRMGSVKYPELHKVAQKIWHWCERRNSFVVATYIQSKDNAEADLESRRLPTDTEYELADSSFKALCKTFGSPVVDLFASRNNRKCAKFVSWHRDPEAFAFDAFTIPWRGTLYYAFPPFSLIPKVLQKIIADKSDVILVVPYWPTQPWFPLFTKLLVNEPIIFNPRKDLLLSLDREPHPLWRNLSLVAGRLSSKHSEETSCQKRPYK